MEPNRPKRDKSRLRLRNSPADVSLKKLVVFLQDTSPFVGNCQIWRVVFLLNKAMCGGHIWGEQVWKLIQCNSLEILLIPVFAEIQSQRGKTRMLKFTFWD